MLRMDKTGQSDSQPVNNPTLAPDILAEATPMQWRMVIFCLHLGAISSLAHEMGGLMYWELVLLVLVFRL
jgi:hypothetical protein